MWNTISRMEIENCQILFSLTVSTSRIVRYTCTAIEDEIWKKVVATVMY